MAWNPFARKKTASPASGGSGITDDLRAMWLRDEPGTGMAVACMDWGVGGSAATLLCAEDGSASFYVRNGASFIGLHGIPEINAAARGFVKHALAKQSRLSPVTEWPLPQQGQFTFYLRSEGRVLGAVRTGSELQDPNDGLASLHDAGQTLIAMVRFYDEQRRSR